jgi:hypothetical protein
MKKTLMQFVTAFKAAARRLGRFQTAVVLTIAYFLILCPVGLILRLFGWDPLEAGSRKRERSTNWRKAPEGGSSPEALHRQS